MTFDLVGWLERDALPLWGGLGFDAHTGLFQERLDLDGRPLVDAPRRLMVQARQIFAFATAHTRTWYDGATIVERAGHTMVELFRGDGRPGFAFSVSRDGSIIDPRRDLNAQAFALLALAHLARLTEPAHWLTIADETLAFLDDTMATPSTGGYTECVPGPSMPRHQNPHMHLFEAMLALHEVDPERFDLGRADRLADMLERYFLRGSHRVLVETFDDDFVPFAGQPIAFEPGHHFEWAWLLTKHAALKGPHAPPLASRLIARAMAGVSLTGTIVDEVEESGTVLRGSTRLWPHAEAVRALLTAPEAQPARANSILDTMGARFLMPAGRGCWLDHLDASGAPLTSFVPASSLYHLMGVATSLG